MTSRRDFVKRAAGAGVGAAALGPAHLFARSAPAAADAGEPRAPAIRRSAVRPVAIASGNGLEAVRRATEVLAEGGGTLQGVVDGVNIVERDPEDYTVGYGGLPNEDGVVQLDSCVMHGPTRGAGSVAALEGVKTPSRVAVAVMRYTDHVMLVGDGAREFARRVGFDADQTLLTDYARERWLAWRAELSDRDDWLTPDESGEPIDEFHTRLHRDPPRDTELAQLDSHDGARPWGTINCSAVDRDGDLSGVTTTSGLFFKLPGRVGDSPIIGAGLYVDNEVGACGSTGRGEAVIKTCGSHTVVENMRHGMSPTDACLDALRRIVRWTTEDRLQRPDGRPAFNVNYYAVNKAGEFGGAAIWAGGRYAVSVDGETERRDSAYLFERD